MNYETIMTILFSILGGGGFVAIVQAYANKNKNKSEVTDINVKTAIELERVAMDRYNDMSKTLDLVEGLLSDVKKELTVYKNYVEVLKDLLNNNDIEIPEMKK